MNLLSSPLFKSLSVACCAGVLLSAVSGVHAEGFKYPEIKEDRHGGFTITPLVGSYLYDDDRALDDDTVAGFAIGYRFSHPFAVELVYMDGDVNTTAGASAGEFEQYRLEGLYDVAEYGRWTPYVAVGAASTEFGTTTTADNEGAMTLGLGTLPPSII